MKGGVFYMKPRFIAITDGSKVKVGNHAFCGVGGVIVDTKTSQYTKFSESVSYQDTTYAELYAAKVALKWILSRLPNTNEKVDVLVVTDSAILKKILTEGHQFKSSVLNKLVHWFEEKVTGSKARLNVTAIHIRSHKIEVKPMCEHFRKAGTNFDTLTVYSLMEFNSVADRLAKEAASKQIDKNRKHFGSYGKYVRRRKF